MRTLEQRKKYGTYLRGKNYDEVFGKERTQDIKEKMSKAKIGSKGYWLGKKRPPLSKEWKEKISEKLSGNKSYLWKGGKSFETYSIDWTKSLRISIRERDKYICQLCGEKQGDRAHDIHHIDYNKKNCNTDNLITLCLMCHRKTNHNRDYWIKYFNE